MTSSRSDASVILGRLRAGDAAASEELFALVYDELRALAGSYMRGRDGHTLQATVLVHEAFLRLIEPAGAGEFDGKSHFLAVAARAMRSVLVDHARNKRALKRGGAVERVALDELVDELEHKASDLVALDDALGALAEIDPELARVVELRFFGGLTIDETAKVMGKSTATVERDWRTARLWLKTQLEGVDSL